MDWINQIFQPHPVSSPVMLSFLSTRAWAGLRTCITNQALDSGMLLVQELCFQTTCTHRKQHTHAMFLSVRQKS